MATALLIARFKHLEAGAHVEPANFSPKIGRCAFVLLAAMIVMHRPLKVRAR